MRTQAANAGLSPNGSGQRVIAWVDAVRFRNLHKNDIVMKITAIIERNDNGYYQIYSDDELCGCCFGGYGYSVEEAKADFMKSIEEAKAMIAESGEAIPKEITIEYFGNFSFS